MHPDAVKRLTAEKEERDAREQARDVLLRPHRTFEHAGLSLTVEQSWSSCAREQDCTGHAVWSAAELRELILAVQDLTAERDDARGALEKLREASASGAEAEELASLRAQNAALRAENANMFSLKEENEAMRTEIEKMRLQLECMREAHGLPGASDEHADEAADVL